MIVWPSGLNVTEKIGAQAVPTVVMRRPECISHSGMDFEAPPAIRRRPSGLTATETGREVSVASNRNCPDGHSHTLMEDALASIVTKASRCGDNIVSEIAPWCA